MTNILITGASGRLGSTLAAGLQRQDRQLRLTDRVDRPSSPLSLEQDNFMLADLTELDAVVELSRNIDIVVHTAGIPDEAPFADLLDANILAAFNVFEAARITKVRRVVYASSAHVVGLYPREQQIDVNVTLAPDSLYGVTKAFGEALGSLYSAKHGLEVMSLRIGSFRPKPEDSRQLFTWLSPGDAVLLFSRCIDAEFSGHKLLYGISDNSRRWWHDDASNVIGYAPRDDAERFADSVPQSQRGVLWQGGIFGERDYAGGAG